MLVEVVQGLTGETLRVKLPDNSHVDELLNALKRETEIEQNSQVLICESDPARSLDGQKSFAFYGLPREGYTLFLYDKAWFKTGEGIPTLNLPVPSIEAQLPSQEQSLASSSLMSPASGDVEPMHSAIMNYAASFSHWKAVSEAYSAAETSRQAACTDCVGQLKAQKRASALSLASLKVYLKVVEDSLAGLTSLHQSAMTEFQSMLGGSSLEDAIQELQNTPLHPAHCRAVRVPEGTKLISFVNDVQVLQGRVEGCRRLQEKIKEQVTNARSQFLELSQGIEAEFNRGYKEEDQLLEKASETSFGVNKLCDDVENSKKLFADALEQLEKKISDKDQISWEFMDNIQKRYSLGKETIAQMAQYDKDIQGKLSDAWELRNRMGVVLLQRLQRVAELQSGLLNRKKNWEALLDVAKNEVKRHFGEVQVVLRLPETYKAWCTEVSMRRAYFKAVVSQAEGMSEAAQRMVECEGERRETYVQNHDTLLPETLSRLLNDGGGTSAASRPPRIEINVSGRPKMLPEIDLPDTPKPSLPALPQLTERTTAPGAPSAPAAAAKENARKLEEALQREKEALKAQEQLKLQLSQVQAELASAKEQVKLAEQTQAEASAEQPSADSVSEEGRYREEVESLRKELERKMRFLTEASENSARLELDLNWTKEKLSLEKSTGEKYATGIRKVGELIGLESSKSGSSLLTRSRRTSAERDVSTDETIAAVVTGVQKLVQEGAGAGGGSSSLKISLTSFVEGDVALFMPLGKERLDPLGQRLYMAFNLKCPRHYLDPHSLSAFMASDPERAESYCLGKITKKKQYEPGAEDSEYFGLPAGERIWVCSAEPIPP